jgi:acyl-CoA reductase-like NAD-dependent aldehyde dehydrogenase
MPTILIDGTWEERDSTEASINPATGDKLDDYVVGSSDDIDAAVSAARSALERWRRTPVNNRSDVLMKAVAKLREAYGDEGEPSALKGLITAEVGKRLPEADLEVSESADVLEYYANESPRLLEPERLVLDEELWPSKQSRVVFEPVGVIGVIKPWNYPLELAMWAIAPALAAGNTVVFKPAEQSSLVGLALGKLFDEAGLPPGVLNVITGDAETGRALVSHDGVEKISFTGSVEAGRSIGAECAKQLKRVTLELGGVDPAVVLPDADLELTANGLVWGSFCNAGQVCVRPKRVIIEASLADPLTDLLVQKTKALKKDQDFGPLISEDQLRTVEDQVKSALDGGADLKAGGERLGNKGFFFAPTVLANVSPDMRIVEEECFGPVMPILIADGAAEAIDLANASRYGLGASVWSTDRDAANDAAERLRAGMVWVNDVNVAFPQAPWGGVKQSGIGAELGRWGLDEYTIKKHVSVEEGSDQTRDWWFPYDD